MTTFDVAAFLDVFVALVAMAATARLRAVATLPRFAATWLRRRLSVTFRLGARRRARRRRAERPAANDNGEGWAEVRLAA